MNKLLLLTCLAVCVATTLGARGLHGGSYAKSKLHCDDALKASCRSAKQRKTDKCRKWLKNCGGGGGKHQYKTTDYYPSTTSYGTFSPSGSTGHQQFETSSFSPSPSPSSYGSSYAPSSTYGYGSSPSGYDTSTGHYDVTTTYPHDGEGQSYGNSGGKHHGKKPVVHPDSGSSGIHGILGSLFGGSHNGIGGSPKLGGFLGNFGKNLHGGSSSHNVYQSGSGNGILGGLLGRSKGHSMLSGLLGGGRIH